MNKQYATKIAQAYYSLGQQQAMQKLAEDPGIAASVMSNSLMSGMSPSFDGMADAAPELLAARIKNMPKHLKSQFKHLAAVGKNYSGGPNVSAKAPIIPGSYKANNLVAGLARGGDLASEDIAGMLGLNIPKNALQSAASGVSPVPVSLFDAEIPNITSVPSSASTALTREIPTLIGEDVTDSLLSNNMLRNLGIGGAIAGGLYGGKKLYDYFTEPEAVASPEVQAAPPEIKQQVSQLPPAQQAQYAELAKKYGPYAAAGLLTSAAAYGAYNMYNND
jgi:hypothetical protein